MYLLPEVQSLIEEQKIKTKISYDTLDEIRKSNCDYHVPEVSDN